MKRPNRPVLILLRAVTLTLLTATVSGCGLIDSEQPSAEVMEAEIARCLDIDPSNVNFSWKDDGAAFTVGTSGPKDVDDDQYTRCIERVLGG